MFRKLFHLHPEVNLQLVDRIFFSVSLQFADPTLWGSSLSPNHAEPDDNLYNPEFKDGKLVDSLSSSSGTSGRAIVGCLVILSRSYCPLV
jgi:hypothetical protein